MSEPCMVCTSTDFDAMKTADWTIAGLGKVPVTFGVCRDCGHIQQNPLPAPETIEAFYARFSNYFLPAPDWRPPEVPDISTRTRLKDLATRFKPELGSLYEIGCGNGINLYYIQQAGWKVGGCEPSPEAGNQASNLIGAPIEIGFAEDVLTGSASHDVVILSHVLEHVPDPRSLLDVARGEVKPDGFLIVEVPCSRQPHLLCPGWLALEHLSYFTDSSLGRLLEEAGFEIMEIVIDDQTPKSPAIAMVCRLADPAAAAGRLHFNRYPENRAFLERHLEIDGAHWARVASRFAHVKKAYIWAAGVHTAQLFSETGVDQKVELLGLIDSSPLKVGQYFGPYEIISKERFLEVYDGEHIIISSFNSEAEIAKSLVGMGLPEDKIVTLYT